MALFPGRISRRLVGSNHVAFSNSFQTSESSIYQDLEAWRLEGLNMQTGHDVIRILNKDMGNFFPFGPLIFTIPISVSWNLFFNKVECPK
jgi:hypothetical protein